MAAPVTAAPVTVAPVSTWPVAAAPVTHPADETGPQDQLEPGVRLVLDQVDPTVARIGEPLTLEGRIVNDGTEGRRLTTVSVRAGWTALDDRSEVAAWVDGSDGREAGWILGAATVGPVVAPGRQIPFHVEVPEETLTGLSQDATVLGVEIRAVDQDGADPVQLRTVLPVTRADRVDTPLQHTWVVPLTLPPDPALTSTDQTARQEAWHAAVGPGSAVRTWLDALDHAGATWLVDPSLLVQPTPAASLSEALSREPEGEPGGEPGEETTSGTATGTPTPTASPSPQDGADDPAGATGDGSAVTASPPQPTGSPADRGLDVGRGLGSLEEPDGEPLVITAEVVQDDLEDLRRRLTDVPTEQLWWLPTADPDVAALLDLEVSAPTGRAAMRLPLADHPEKVDALLERGRHDVAWPALSAPSADDVGALDRLWSVRPTSPEGVSVVMMPLESLTGGSARPVGRAAARLRAHPDVTALGVDSRAAGLLAHAEQDAVAQGVGAVVQQLLADNLTAYLQHPGSPRSLVYGPHREASVPPAVLHELTEGLQEAPWTEAVDAGRLVAAAAATEPAALTGSPPDPDVLGELVLLIDPPPRALDAGRVRSLIRLDRELGGLAQILGATAAVESWRPVLAQQWSTRWRHEPDLWPRPWHLLRSLVSDVSSGVHVNPSTVNFLSDSGIMQVTVVNDLPVEVEGVRVEVVPDKSFLRIVEQPEPISIGAESRATVSFTARAVARGKTTVTAQLTAPNGTRLGDDTEVLVRVRPAGVWIYWVLGTAAGLVLVLGLLRALRPQRPQPGKEARR